MKKYSTNGALLAQWASAGTEDGEFGVDPTSNCDQAIAGPTGIAADASGNVYVADYVNERIQKFDSDGGFITKWATTKAPLGIALDSSGNVYSYLSSPQDGSTDGIQKYDPQGNSLGTAVDASTLDATKSPTNLAVSPSGQIFVSQQGNPDTVARFSAAGAHLNTWSVGSSGIRPQDVAFHAARSIVFVAEQGTSRFSAWTPTGAALFTRNEGAFVFGVDVDGNGHVYSLTGTRVRKYALT